MYALVVWRLYLTYSKQITWRLLPQQRKAANTSAFVYAFMSLNCIHFSELLNNFEDKELLSFPQKMAFDLVLFEKISNSKIFSCHQDMYYVIFVAMKDAST